MGFSRLNPLAVTGIGVVFGFVSFVVDLIGVGFSWGGAVMVHKLVVGFLVPVTTFVFFFVSFMWMWVRVNTTSYPASQIVGMDRSGGVVRDGTTYALVALSLRGGKWMCPWVVAVIVWPLGCWIWIGVVVLS